MPFFLFACKDARYGQEKEMACQVTWRPNTPENPVRASKNFCCVRALAILVGASESAVHEKKEEL
ncbi:MAG: hypothetical protein NVSMB49_25240 [Ktedonobacteraceae bacterium]